MKLCIAQSAELPADLVPLLEASLAEGFRFVERLRHLYVAARYRRQGVGRGLVQHALTGAGEHFDVVRVRTDTREADLFYLALGFSRLLSSREATHELRLRGSSAASGEPW